MSMDEKEETNISDKLASVGERKRRQAGRHLGALTTRIDHSATARASG